MYNFDAKGQSTKANSGELFKNGSQTELRESDF
jgi:hypothetical protein